MTTVSVPLDSLAQRIARQQAELQALREELEARQARLADLSSRKKELESELRQVDAEMRAVNQGKGLRLPKKARPGKPAVVPASGSAEKRPKLSHLLVALVRESKEPVTIKQLAEEVVGRKYPTTSKNIPNLVVTRVKELVDKGILQRTKDQRGIVLGSSPGAAKAPEAKAVPAKKGTKRPKAASKARTKGQQKTLREILAELLAKSPQPVPGSELAKQAQGQGYVSNSKNFTQVIYVTLSKMDSVENVPGQGYRLKKG